MFFTKLLVIFFQLYSVISWCLYSSTNLTTGKINEVDWSPDGKYISVASDVVTVYLFNTLTPIWSKNYTSFVTTAKFSKLGKLLAVGTNANDTVYIYNVPVFGQNATTNVFSNSSAHVYQVDFSPDDKKIIACGTNGFVSTNNVGGGGSGNKTNLPYPSPLTSGPRDVWSCKYSDVNDVIGLACTGCAYTAYFLNASNLSVIGQTNTTNPLYDVDIQPGAYTPLFTGYSGANSSAISINVSWSSGVIGSTPGNMSVVSYYNLGNLGSSDNVLAVSCSLDSTYIVFGENASFTIINTTKIIRDVIFNYTSAVWGVRASDDSNYVVIGTNDGTIDVYSRMCGTCPNGEYLNGNQCILCALNITGCSACENATFCYSCFLGYYVNVTTSNFSSVCVQCQISLPGCEYCFNKSVCQKCDSSYYLSGSNCTKCNDNIPNCQQCDTNGICLKCGYMTYLNNNNCSRCTDAIPNCINCYQAYNKTSTPVNPLYCLMCRQGFYVSNSTTCTACSTNCLYCLNTVCVQCASLFQLNPTSKTCTACTIPHCLTCDQQGNQCDQCAPSTTNTSSSVCTPCVSPCVTCSGTTSTCTSCEVGYFLNGSVCSNCPGCQICNPATGKCLACPSGSYLNTASNNCTLCLNTTSHCAICSGSTGSTCSACERNFVLVGSSCNPISGIPNCMIYKTTPTTICQHCAPAYYLDSATSSCLSCPFNCQLCDNVSNCISCFLGYYYNSTTQTCQPCNSSCIACNSSSQCLSCGNGYYLNGSSCLNCTKSLPNCYKCLDQLTCVNCQSGYFIGSDGKCALCTSPCETCVNSTTTCLSCIIGYNYSLNKCTSCSSGCQTCISNNCTSCIVGYVLNQTSPNIYSCVNCSLLYSNCQYCNQNGCLFCNSYYMLNSDNVCQKCNISNCVQCDNAGLCTLCSVGLYSDSISCKNCSTTLSMCEKCGSGSSCDKCMMGFYVNAASSCSKCMAGCTVCSNVNTCITCEVGFLNISNVCKTCDQVIPGCIMCSQTDNCSLCSHGYYLELGVCTFCRDVLQGCANCDSNSHCLSCDRGYFMNSSNACELCSSQPGCQICNPLNKTCTVCSSGYFLDTNNTCQLCSVTDNCIYCNSSTCLTCKTGYYLSSNICQSCHTIHQFCTICNSTNCFECLSGYYITSSSTNCQQCNISGCSICSPNGTVCLSCSNMYYMVGTICKYCEDMDFGCLTCNDKNQCLICKTGYFLNNNGVCSLCSQGCSICSQQMCITCQSNYFINESSPNKSCSVCSSFVPGCQLCLNQTNCLTCDSGYFMNSTLLCQSCRDLFQCTICSDNDTCIFCQVESYLLNGECLLCSSAIKGCYSCATPQVCLSCQGNFKMNQGKCVSVASSSHISVIASDDLLTVNIDCQYISETRLKVTLYTINWWFYKIQQNWKDVVTLQLVPPPSMGSNPIQLTIINVDWGSSNPLNSLSFYTDNPLGNINVGSGGGMPIVGNFPNRRLLITFQQLNIILKFNMKRAVIDQLIPSLDTNGQDLNLQYNLDEPQFYKSVLKQQKQYYWIFGFIITILFVLLYLLKICWTVPTTKDVGEIIPHVLLMKAPAMVFYPSFGGYISYCYGFSIIDFPMFNTHFSEKLTQQFDRSPPSYKMFYNNLNIASTYFLALLVFIFLMILLITYMFYQYSLHKYSKSKSVNDSKNYNNFNSSKKHKNSKKKNFRSDDQYSNFINYIFIKTHNFQSFVYNIFIAGLAFNSVISIVGMMLNPSSIISAGGFFYILGAVIFAAVVGDAIRSFFSLRQNFNKLRVIAKAMFLGVMFISPIPLFVGMIVIDVSMMIYEYRVKRNQWVVPQLRLYSQSSCLIGYTALIFMSNMKFGIIIASLCVSAVLLIDIYLHYKERCQAQKIINFKKVDLAVTQQSLSIENLQPSKLQQINNKVEKQYSQKKQQDKIQGQKQNNNKITQQQNISQIIAPSHESQLNTMSVSKNNYSSNANLLLEQTEQIK